MRILRLYLDTSVINFLFAEDAPEKRDVTREFFEEYVKRGIYHANISPVVLDEIGRTRDERKRKELLSVVEEYGLVILDITKNIDEIQTLAEVYLESGVVPRRKIEDALHIAIATVNEIDILLSWNYRHLANVNKEILINSVNLRTGYIKPIRLGTPLEVIHEEN